MRLAEAGLRTALQPGLISGVALWGTDGATGEAGFRDVRRASTTPTSG